MASDLPTFLQRLPKTETHLHLEGALPWRLLQSLDKPEYAEEPQWRRPGYVFPDFATFESVLFPAALSWFTSVDRYHEAAKAIFADHLAQNVRYVETSFHSGILPLLHLDGRELLAAIKDAIPPGLTVQLYMGILRTAEEEGMQPLLDEALTWEGLDGIDLHGVEKHPLPSWVAPYWQRAREAGKQVKAHAGEYGPADNVREVVRDLGVRRVQHGVRAAEDPLTLEFLRDEGVVLDVCPISNVKLGVAPSMREHPARALLEASVPFTISTDDPCVFANTVTDEYKALAREQNFTPAELGAVAKTGFAVADLDPGAKTKALAEIDAAVAAASP